MSFARHVVCVFTCACAADPTQDTDSGSVGITVQVEPGEQHAIRVDGRDWAVTVVSSEDDECLSVSGGGSMCPTLDLSAYHVEVVGLDGDLFLATTGSEDLGCVVNETRRTWLVTVE